MRNKNWYALSVSEALDKLKTGKNGLSEAEALSRSRRFGANSLPEKKRFTNAGVALSQLKSPIVYVLLLAALVSLMLGEFVDMAVILFAVLINTVVGFIQEIKAEQAMAALKQVVAHMTYVRRDGIEKEIGACEVVRGDILILKAGDLVPADARVLETYELEVEEAALTGEAVPVRKEVKASDQAGQEESKKNMVYLGSKVLKGRGVAVVTETGSATKYGQIALLVDALPEEDTPLQDRLRKFSNQFGVITFFVLVFVLIIGLYRGLPFIEIFTIAVAIAVAAIPEGLLVAVTIILAVGMQRILKSGSLVRRLVAAETLGSVSIICTDKTGTLTKGTMQVDHIVTSGASFLVNNDFVKEQLNVGADGDHMEAIRIGIIASDAVIENPQTELEEWVIHGDYTERAFLWAGLCAGFDPLELGKSSVRMSEIPFDADRKFMATLNKEGDIYKIYVKGSAEELLSRSSHILRAGKVCHLGEEELRGLRQKQDEMSRQGLRVLAVAFKDIDKISLAVFKESNEEDVVSGLTFVGLMALKDPLREEAYNTLETARSAGIRTVIVTGDNALTARALANELGLKVEDENVLEGSQLDHMSTKELSSIVNRIKLYARVSPRHKLRIIEAWQARGEVVAMTGDGVNDAPALKRADIGIALGSGTEVAKETADMVLLDDNFRSIVTAIQEGRVIFENVRKVILYLISDSFSEVVVVAGSLLLGLMVPVTAAQILWINIITDGFPNIALTLEPKDAGIMTEKPRRRSEPLFSGEMKTLMVAISAVSGLLSLAIFYYSYALSGDFVWASTLTFSILAVDSLIYVFSLRSLTVPLYKQDLFSNPSLILAVLLAFAFQLLAVYDPFLQSVLHTRALGALDWVIVLLASLFTATIAELIKSLYALRGETR
jgi:Ca2+-transporting ATPase